MYIYQRIALAWEDLLDAILSTLGKKLWLYKWNASIPFIYIYTHVPAPHPLTQLSY